MALTIGLGLVALAIVLLAGYVAWPDLRADAEERRQAAYEERGQAALEALRKLGRDYGRPKNY